MKVSKSLLQFVIQTLIVKLIDTDMNNINTGRDSSIDDF